MKDKELEIIKTQGTKESIGAFMVFDKKGNVKGYITNAELQKSLTKN